MCSGFPHCSQESCALPIIGGLLGAYLGYASPRLSHRVPVQNKARRRVEAGTGTDLSELEGAVATAGGNRLVSPRHQRRGHRPLKAEPRVGSRLEPPAT